MSQRYSLSSVGAVVHEEEVQVADVVDEESLVAGRHHVASLAVVTVTNLYSQHPSALIPGFHLPAVLLYPPDALVPPSCSHLLSTLPASSTHLWHGSLTLETSADSVVDTLWLPPAWVHAHEAVTLVAVEPRGDLLHDRDMLLCGDHLCDNVSISGIAIGVFRRGRSRTVTAVWVG